MVRPLGGSPVQATFRTGSFSVSDARERSDACKLYFLDDPGKTDQSFREDCDLNNILRKADLNLLAAHAAQYQGEYNDFTGIVDKFEAMCAVKEAESMFNSLPARTRARFNNDPYQFVDFATNEANRDEIIDLGLGKPGALKSAQIASNAVLEPVKEAPQKPDGGVS